MIGVYSDRWSFTCKVFATPCHLSPDDSRYSMENLLYQDVLVSNSLSAIEDKLMLFSEHFDLRQRPNLELRRFGELFARQSDHGSHLDRISTTNLYHHVPHCRPDSQEER